MIVATLMILVVLGVFAAGYLIVDWITNPDAWYRR